MRIVKVDPHTASKSELARVKRAQKLATRLSDHMDGADLDTVADALLMLLTGFLVLECAHPMEAAATFAKALQTNVLYRSNIDTKSAQ